MICYLETYYGGVRRWASVSERVIPPNDYIGLKLLLRSRGKGKILELMEIPE